jgi:hypothetical protein
MHWTFFGGVMKAAVPDNLKAGITKPSRYEPGINRTYQDFADHWLRRAADTLVHSAIQPAPMTGAMR